MKSPDKVGHLLDRVDIGDIIGGANPIIRGIWPILAPFLNSELAKIRTMDPAELDALLLRVSQLTANLRSDDAVLELEAEAE